MMKIEDYSLGNGLRVVLNQDRSAPLVAVNLWYHVGSKNERPGRTGFAHLFEHMLFSGSANVGNNEHFKYVQSVGGVLNGTTFFDRTNYYETVPSNYLALALWLESDRMGFFLPALTQEKLDVQKNVVQEERRLRYDNAPYGTWFEELLFLAFEESHPYHWPTIGSMEDIAAADLDDVRDFFQTFYGPQNAVLTVAGDFDVAEARDHVARYFSEIEAGAPIEPIRAERIKPTWEQRKTIVSPVQLPRSYRLYHLPAMGETDWFAADLLSGILSSGKASRLDRSLVYEKKIAQDVSVFVLPTELTGMLILAITPKQGISIAEVEEAADAEIARIAAGGVTEDEMARVLNQTETDHAHQVEQLEHRADLIGMYTTFFDDPSLVNRWLDRYRAIDRSAIQAVAKKYFTEENSVAVEFHPDAKGIVA